MRRFFSHHKRCIYGSLRNRDYLFREKEGTNFTDCGLGWEQLGLAIRGLVTAHVPAQSFILVTLGSLLVLMVSWRITFVYVFSSNEKSLEARPTSRKGGAFEFLQVRSVSGNFHF